VTSGHTGSITGVGRRVEVCAAFEIFPLLRTDEVRAQFGGSPSYGIRRHRSHAALFLSTAWAAMAIASHLQRPATFAHRARHQLDPVIGRETEIERVMTVSDEPDGC
jgi:hypothetical protein